MSRCDYDGVFYRVFCVTLLATAFTFTVILTNVFIDIDGLLSKKAKQNQDHKEIIDYTENGVNTEITKIPYEPISQNVYDKNNVDDQPETPYRTKRSLDSTKYLTHMKNYKMIRALINQLAKLLEQTNDDIDEGSTAINNKVETINDLDDIEYDKTTVEEDYRKIKDVKRNGSIKKKNIVNNDLDEAMHKILARGIKEHMDINYVYKEIEKLLKKNAEKTSQIEGDEINDDIVNHIELHKTLSEKRETSSDRDNASEGETKFLNEIIKCGDPNKEIGKRIKKTTAVNTQTEPELFIKTIIEIKPIESNKVKYKTISYDQDKSKSTAKVGYKRQHANNEGHNLSNDKHDCNKTFELRSLKRNSNSRQKSHELLDIIPKPDDRSSYLGKALEYLEKHSFRNNKQLATFINGMNENGVNRSKRQIKIKYMDYGATTPRIKPVRKFNKKTDDELYVEIETHFDGTGAKGEKKKKLVKNLIERIQKAIRSDASHEKIKKKLHQRMHIRKRTQNPLKHKNQKRPDNYVLKMHSIEHRQLNPINKILVGNDVRQDKVDEPMDWEQPYFEPSSLAVPNTENSVELNNHNLDFNNVLSSGIPQRVQVPLNTRNADINEQSRNTNTDKDNATLYIKDIDGSGFSVGFNQYVDEPPDVDSMRLFSGLENLIETYHENYDQNNNDENANANEIEDSIEKQHALMKRNADIRENEHVLLRNSARGPNEEDYHSNAYKVIYDKKFLPYDNYEDILRGPNAKSLTSSYKYRIRNYNYNPKNIKIFTSDIQIRALPVILDDDILEKNLKPSEILSLASLLLNKVRNRKKRSMNVRKVTNIKSRMKLNRYINTNDMKAKAVFLKNKRNKREVNKIRVIATDSLHDVPKNSDENIFLVSGENLFTNRAVLREIELPESDTGDEVSEDHYDEAVPYTYEEPNTGTNYIANVFGAKYRHNALMSKYPHLFTGSATESKESHFGNGNDEYTPSGSDTQKYNLENLLGMHITTENNASAEKDVRIPDIVNAIMPSSPKSNYKVTVKISPKNVTNAPSGFKEMHTVINKTYNNNGVQYYSLVNVSEISKIEKVNKTREVLDEADKKSSATNAISEKKNNLKLLLALQKQKIEQQLQNLNRQKENLETILRERDGIKERNVNDLLKEFIHDDSNKGDDSNFVHKPHTSPPHDHNPDNRCPTATAHLATEKPLTTTPSEIHDGKDDEKNKVSASIKENDNLTNEILTKINRNTDILQCFLKKLSDKFDQQLSLRTPPATQRPRAPDRATVEPERPRERADGPKDWGLNLHHLHDTIFNDNVPNKNDSHYSIPFVYAYQHPYLPQSKQPVPMAKIVYHGHIHTNALHKHLNDQIGNNANVGNYSKPQHSSAAGGNYDGSKFFIDTLARDRVEVTPGHVQKETVHIHDNTTKIN